MSIPNLEDRIKQLLSAAHARDSTIDTEYQQTFQEEGIRKSEYIIQDLNTREERGELDTYGLIYLCIGGADGSEVEQVLKNTKIRAALMVEISNQAADLARDKARQISNELNKEMLVIEGDVTAKLQDIVNNLAIFKERYALTGIVCSAQAVLHELPRRSPGFDLSVFLGKIYQDPNWETVGFYSREPCKPFGWPDVVELRIKDVTGDSLRRFAVHVAQRLGLPQKAENIANDWVQVSGIVALELLHKLLRNDTTGKLNYELEEQLTQFDPDLTKTILGDHVPGIKVTVEHIITEGIRKALELHEVQFRTAEHKVLSTPMTHVRIIGIRISNTSTNHDKVTFHSPEKDGTTPPLGSTASRLTGNPRSNLGASPYSRFIKRNKVFEEVIEGLMERTSLVLITGKSGNGKTSVAYEIATNCLKGEENCPQFNVVVWISDKGNPGSTSLNAVLDEVALTLDYAGLTQLTPPEKRRQIEHLARSQKILIIIDSFETIRDVSLSKWISNLPEPSKALVTIVKNNGEFPETVTEVEIPGMNELETREFVEHRLSTLKLSSLVTNYSSLEPLLRITGGNAKAIETGLGIIKLKKRPLSEVVDFLANAKSPFDDFRASAWALLNQEEKRLMLATYYFPYGIQESLLKSVAQIEDANFGPSIDRLTDVSLLDLTPTGLESVPIYSTHGLVSAFVEKKLNKDQTLQTLLKTNWFRLLRQIASDVGFCWNDISRLSVLDDQYLRQTILFAIDWSFNNKEYASTIALAKDVRYYFYVRGFWSVNVNLRRAEAARLLNDKEEEFSALTYHVNIASKQQNLAEVEAHIERLSELEKSHKMTTGSLIGYHHAMALYWLAKRDFGKAEQLWRENLHDIDSALLPHEYSANLRWLAVSLEKQNRPDEAHKELEKALIHAQSMNFARGIVDIALKQATLFVEESNFSEATGKLEMAQSLLEEIGDRCYWALNFDIEGRIYAANGQIPEAKELFEKALDEFKRLGMNDRAIETEAALANIMID